MTFFAAKTSSAVADKDRAETFTEPSVSVSATNTRVTGAGDVRIISETGATRSADEYNTDTAVSELGITINPNVDTNVVEAKVSSQSSGLTTAYLRETDGTLLDQTDITGLSSGDPFLLTAPMSAGTDYYVYGDADGDNYTRGGELTGEYPHTSPSVDIVAGHNGETIASYNFNDVTCDPDTSGSVTVGWPAPQDIYAWDTAVYQTTDEGQSVEVFIEEDRTGGWTEIAGPISRGESIDADTLNNVRYRVEMSRSDASKMPTLDAIYRRYKL